MKKLIYFNLGNNVELIELAKLCIISLENQKYDGDFLFITNYKQEILKKIKCNNKVVFLELNENDLNPAFFRFKIYEFEKIYDYDQILYCDTDILFFTNPDKIFDLLNSDHIFVSNDTYVKNITCLMTTKIESLPFWGENLLSNDEKLFIENNKVLAINAGIFAFNKNMISNFAKIDNFIKENKNLILDLTLDQPFFNVFLFREKNYKNVLNDLVNHNGLDVLKNQNEEFERKEIIHFAGEIGVATNKILAMEKVLKLTSN